MFLSPTLLKVMEITFDVMRKVPRKKKQKVHAWVGCIRSESKSKS